MDLKYLYNGLRNMFVRSKSSLPFDQTAIKPYFLPIFYFSSADSENGGSAHGLLCDDYSYEVSNSKIDINESFRIGDSAYNFFVTNGDDYRADQVKLFNTILYTMSNKAPWHFTKVDLALGDVIHKQLTEGKFDIEGATKQLTLSMSPDTEDRMHHTFFNIYKNLLWDSERDVMLLPKNLRQFNMGLILFTPPITFFDGLNCDDIHQKIYNRLCERTYHTDEKDRLIPDAREEWVDGVDTNGKSLKGASIQGTNVYRSGVYTNVEKITYKWDYKNLPYYEKLVKERNINVRMNLSDTTDQSSWWTFIELRGCEFEMKDMLTGANISVDNTAGGLCDEDKIVINFKKAYITTCEKFFDLGLTDIPSQYGEYSKKTSASSYGEGVGSKVWNVNKV